MPTAFFTSIVGARWGIDSLNLATAGGEKARILLNVSSASKIDSFLDEGVHGKNCACDVQGETIHQYPNLPRLSSCLSHGSQMLVLIPQ